MHFYNVRYVYITSTIIEFILFYSKLFEKRTMFKTSIRNF